MANRAAFNHRPGRKLTSVVVDPSRPLFKALFDAAMKQDWWEDGVGMLAINDYDKFYFQITGVDGLACLEFDVEGFLREIHPDPRTAMEAVGMGGSLRQVLEGGDVYSKGTKRLWEALNEAA